MFKDLCALTCFSSLFSLGNFANGNIVLWLCSHASSLERGSLSLRARLQSKNALCGVRTAGRLAKPRGFNGASCGLWKGFS